MTILENQGDEALELEAKITRLQDDLNEQIGVIRGFEEGATQSKNFFC